jgi:site-specific DNA-cytosine methylase
MLVLSLFPGIGLLDMAFEAEGFCVVRGPDCLWGGDIRSFQPPAGKFDGVIGGPPCQMFSSLVHLVRASGHEPRFGNLIPEFERCVAAARPQWFVMENVPAAPEPSIEGYGVKSFLLDNSALNDGHGYGLEQRRVRRFSFGLLGRAAPNLCRWIDLAVFLLPDASGADRNAVIAGGGLGPNSRDKRRRTVVASDQPDNREEEKRRGSTKRRSQDVTAGHEQPAGLTARKAQKATVTSIVGGKGRRSAVTGSDDGPSERMGRYKLADACRLQGLPEDFLSDAPFTADGKLKAVANGVPRAMGLAIARAIKEALKECGHEL